MRRGHGVALGVLAALVIAVAIPRGTHHASPPGGNRATIGFKSHEALREHFREHGPDFGAADAFAYLELAQALRDRPPGRGVLELRRGDGVTTRFDRSSGAFLAFDAEGVIRTFFKPHDGEAYFRRQAARERH